MMQFNEDGSLKLSSSTIKRKQDNEERMKRGKCLLIRKELVNFTAPKRCLLHIRLSDGMSDNRFVENIHKYFKEGCAVPTKISKLNDKEFDVEIGTDFKRCSDCANLIGKYREFMDGNIIEEKGNCTFEGFRKSFCYEDYFD